MASLPETVASGKSLECADPERLAPNNDDGNVHISGAPAVVTWIDEKDNKTTNYLCHSAHDHVTLYVERDSSSNTAFFQLRANVSLKARRDKTHVFLSIRPESIESVVTVARDDHQVSTTLGTSTYGLEFKLASVPVLIVPKGDVTPKQKSSRLVLDLLRTLAKQTCFTVHFATTTLAKDHLVSLCEATSAGALRSTPRFLDVASLYGGKGGHILELESTGIGNTITTSVGAEFDSPPSYDEPSGVDPSLAHASAPESKRPVSRDLVGHSANSASQSPVPSDVEPARALIA